MEDLKLSQDMINMLYFYKKHNKKMYFHYDFETIQVFNALKNLELLKSIGPPTACLAKITQKGINYCDSKKQPL